MLFYAYSKQPKLCYIKLYKPFTFFVFFNLIADKNNVN